MNDFVGQPTKVSTYVRGIGGMVKSTYMGTVRWSVEDDNGAVHTWDIPGSYYNESSPYRLLSPQHWAQSSEDGRGTWCGTFDDAVELYWNGTKFCRTVVLDPASNIAVLRSAPGYHGFKAFCTQIADVPSPLESDAHLHAMNAEVTDDESSDAEEDAADVPIRARQHPDMPDERLPTDEQGTDKAEFDLPLNHDVVPEDDEVQGVSPQAELLAWHYRLGHISFERQSRPQTF